MGNDKKKGGAKDKRIGNNLRLLRLSAGLAQAVIAEQLGVTYQQVQKYESGESRVSASMLHDLSVLYNVSYESFFDGLEADRDVPQPLLHDNETLKILAVLSSVNDPALKSKIGKVVRLLAE